MTEKEKKRWASVVNGFTFHKNSDPKAKENTITVFKRGTSDEASVEDIDEILACLRLQEVVKT